MMAYQRDLVLRQMWSQRSCAVARLRMYLERMAKLILNKDRALRAIMASAWMVRAVTRQRHQPSATLRPDTLHVMHASSLETIRKARYPPLMTIGLTSLGATRHGRVLYTQPQIATSVCAGQNTTTAAVCTIHCHLASASPPSALALCPVVSEYM